MFLHKKEKEKKKHANAEKFHSAHGFSIAIRYDPDPRFKTHWRALWWGNANAE